MRASGSRGTRTHNPRLADTCFRDRPLIRPDDFLVLNTLISLRELRGLESNQRPPGSEPGVTTNSNCPAINESLSCDKVRGEGFEPPSPASKAGSLPLADPRASPSISYLNSQKCPAGVEPASPAWKAGTFAARPRARCFKCGSRGTRTHKRVVLAACFQDRSLIRPDGFRRTITFPTKLRRQESNLRQGD
jgi:hypothetical protein